MPVESSYRDLFLFVDMKAGDARISQDFGRSESRNSAGLPIFSTRDSGFTKDGERGLFWALAARSLRTYDWTYQYADHETWSEPSPLLPTSFSFLLSPSRSVSSLPRCSCCLSCFSCLSFFPLATPLPSWSLRLLLSPALARVRSET